MAPATHAASQPIAETIATPMTYAAPATLAAPSGDTDAAPATYVSPDTFELNSTFVQTPAVLSPLDGGRSAENRFEDEEIGYDDEPDESCYDEGRLQYLRDNGWLSDDNVPA